MLRIALKHNVKKELQWKSKLGLISTFLVGQGLVQAINLLSGFFLIRWLSVEEYAQFSVAFAFQSTAQTLVELGLSGAIIALVGSRVNEKQTIGEYIKAGKYYRSRLFIVISCICIVAFPLVTHQHGWSIFVTIILLISILCNLFFSGNSAYYTSPLRMHKKLKDLYSVQLKSSIGRLILLGSLTVFSMLNAWLAALLSSITVWYNGKAYKKRAQTFIDEPESSTVSTRREMFQYVRPVMPGIVYSAFSAQIAIFIISIFGNAGSIAEVGALGRLGQLFLILNAASSTLVVPFLARQARETLIRKYVTIVVGAVVVVTLITSCAFLFPQPLLWIIGSKYAHLKDEVGLLILNSSITLINVLMWDMNCSRKWLWTWIPIVSISSNILLQLLLVINMDLSTTYNVLIFSIILSLSNLLNKILVAFIGLKKNQNETYLLPKE